MLREIFCNLGFHKWNRWKLSEKGKTFYENKLIRTCKHCSEKEYYIGITEIDSKGKYSPYNFKH